MKICICDDDLKQCEYLTELIMAHNKSHVITSFHSAEEMLFECENHFPFDCVFLDIQMKEMNGIDLAKQIRQIDSKIIIVFFKVIFVQTAATLIFNRHDGFKNKFNKVWR